MLLKCHVIIQLITTKIELIHKGKFIFAFLPLEFYKPRIYFSSVSANEAD